MKKRFGLINMAISKEGEETVFSFEKQIEKLTDENDKLKDKLIKKDIIIKEKNIEIKVLKEENEAHKNQIYMLKKLIPKEDYTINENCIHCNGYVDLHNRNKGINKCDTCLIKENKIDDIKIINNDIKNNKPKFIPAHKMLDEENNIFNNRNIKESNASIPTPTPSVSGDNDSIDVNYDRLLRNKEIFKLTVNKLILIIRIKKWLENIKKETHTNERISTSKPETPKKVRKQRNRDLPAIERYPVKVFNKTNSEILNFVSEENKILIKFQYKIAEKLDKKIEEITIDDIIDYKIKTEDLTDNRDQRKRLRFKIQRCKILYEKFGEKLNRFKISLHDLSEMPEKVWKVWLPSFEDIVNDLYKDSIKCDYTYKNNKKCNRYDCKIKHKDNI